MDSDRRRTGTTPRPAGSAQRIVFFRRCSLLLHYPAFPWPAKQNTQFSSGCARPAIAGFRRSLNGTLTGILTDPRELAVPAARLSPQDSGCRYRIELRAMVAGTSSAIDFSKRSVAVRAAAER